MPPCKAAPSDVFVLDFDGVLADSQREVSTAGLQAAAARWPAIFSDMDAAARENVLQGLAAVRPRLVNGYETMVMARLIAQSADNVRQIVEPDSGLAWDAPGGLLESTLAAWGETEAELMSGFEALRHQTMSRDEAAWAAMVPLYSGVEEALSACEMPFYIASSKRRNRLTLLLNILLVLQLEEDSPRVLGGLIPPNEKKIEALR